VIELPHGPQPRVDQKEVESPRDADEGKEAQERRRKSLTPLNKSKGFYRRMRRKAAQALLGGPAKQEAAGGQGTRRPALRLIPAPLAPQGLEEPRRLSWASDVRGGQVQPKGKGKGKGKDKGKGKMAKGGKGKAKGKGKGPGRG
jgi:hypothetical protein